MPSLGSDALNQGLNTGSTLFQRLMQPALERERLKQQDEHFKSNLALQQQSQARASSLLPYDMMVKQAQAKKALMDSDPTAKAQYVSSLLNQIMNLGGRTSTDELSNAETIKQSFVPSIDVQNTQSFMPSIAIPPSMALSNASQNANQSLFDELGFSIEDIARGILAKELGVSTKTPVQEVYQGAAREAYDLERLRRDLGSTHPAVQNAERLFNAKMQQQEDLSALRTRTREGLRSGERWIHDEKGQVIGKERPPSEKEKEEHHGRGFFNYAYPYIVEGLSPFAGKGSWEKLKKASKLYGKNQQATNLIDNYLLGLNLINPVTAKEMHTLGTGVQQKVFERVREGLKVDDIPQNYDSFIKRFSLPSSAIRKSKEAFQKILNEAQEAGYQQIPPFIKEYNASQEVVTYNPDTKRFE